MEFYVRVPGFAHLFHLETLETAILLVMDVPADSDGIYRTMSVIAGLREFYPLLLEPGVYASAAVVCTRRRLFL